MQKKGRNQFSKPEYNARELTEEETFQLWFHHMWMFFIQLSKKICDETFAAIKGYHGRRD